MQSSVAFGRSASVFVAACLTQCRNRLAADVRLYGIIGIYTACGLGLLWFARTPNWLSYDQYLEKWPKLFLLVMPCAAMTIEMALVLIRFGRRRALAYRRAFSARRIGAMLSGMVLMMGFMVFQGTFTSIKNALPTLRGGFPGDRIQADIDAWLHFGVDPWRWLHAVAGFDWLRIVIEFNYGPLWFLTCFGALFFVATSAAADGIRRRYMLLFLAVWIGCGNILAGLFLSAGPAFYGVVTGDHARFAELNAFLSLHPWQGSAAFYQAYLWNLHHDGQPGFGSGISAFPSIHVGLITLNALFLHDHSRRLGMLAFVYVAIIQISSVYLGWHYAIDGYVSILVVTAAYYGLSALRVGARLPRADGVIGMPTPAAT